MGMAQEGKGPDDADASTFDVGRPVWLGRLDRVRNVVRQELIARQPARHMPARPCRILDVGAGQGTQSIRLARAGHEVLAIEPDPDMRVAFEVAVRLRGWRDPRCAVGISSWGHGARWG